MNYIRRTLCLLLAAAMLLLAGCGQGKTGDGGSASPQDDGLQDTILWINGTHAVLTELNGWDYTVFGGIAPGADSKKLMADMLEEWWDVTDRESAIENMDWLLTEGHRSEFAELMVLLDEEGMTNSGVQEVADVLGVVFEDEDTGFYLARAYDGYRTRGPGAIDGWDLCRAMSLLGWYYIAGYYTESEALDKALEVGQVIQRRFSSWDELMDSYFLGYEYWSIADSADRRAVYEDIKSRPGSPYAVDWNTPLERSWEPAGSVPGESFRELTPAAPTEETVYTKDFGSYTIPAGWVESSQYSTADKYFYLPADQEYAQYPDNVSIEMGTNRYAAEDHAQFREAIVAQLMAQLQNVDAELLGDGVHTDAGDVMYVFTIQEPDVTTRQYYVVGDQKYCLIHLTNYTGSQDTDDAAQRIAKSFQWA